MAGALIPARGLVFVRPIRTAETLPGGKIILTENVREQWTGQQVEVTAVGEWARCEDEDCQRLIHCQEADDDAPRFHICDVKAGDWVLVTARSYVEIAPRLWAVPQDEMLAVIEL